MLIINSNNNFAFLTCSVIGLKQKASDITKLYDMGNEMDRRPFLERLFGFMDEKGKPIATMPTISKNPLDLYKLYHCVREKGGFIEVGILVVFVFFVLCIVHCASLCTFWKLQRSDILSDLFFYIGKQHL